MIKFSSDISIFMARVFSYSRIILIAFSDSVAVY